MSPATVSHAPRDLRRLHDQRFSSSAVIPCNMTTYYSIFPFTTDIRKHAYYRDENHKWDQHIAKHKRLWWNTIYGLIFAAALCDGFSKPCYKQPLLVFTMLESWTLCLVTSTLSSAPSFSSLLLALLWVLFPLPWPVLVQLEIAWFV
jgi:hypothetical protein